MINHNYYAVLDIETDGTNPRKCNPLQLATVMVHPRTLSVVDGSDFSAWMRPPAFDKDKDKWLQDNRDCIVNFHCRNFKMSPSDFISMIESSPTERQVWKNYTSYLKSWYIPGKSKTKFNAPIFTGYNIHKFDKVIMDRLAGVYGNLDTEGVSKLFCVKHCIDLKDSVFMWSESLTTLPNYKLDTLREVFGINCEGTAHEGLKDCYDEAELLKKYLNLHRYFSQKVKGWQ